MALTSALNYTAEVSVVLTFLMTLRGHRWRQYRARHARPDASSMPCATGGQSPPGTQRAVDLLSADK